jgi:hypothetical protein
MRRRQQSSPTAIALCACTAIVIAFWWAQAFTYATQGMSFGTMLRFELSHENAEWKSVYWSVAYPICAIGLAIIYGFSTVSESRAGAVILACGTTALSASAFLFVYWPMAVAFNVPSIMAWASALKPNPSGDGILSGERTQQKQDGSLD